MPLSPEAEALVAALEEEIGRPLTTTEQGRASAFIDQYVDRAVSARDQFLNAGWQGQIAEVIDRATHGFLSPGATFDARLLPSVAQVAVAAGGFVSPEEVFYEGFAPGTPALYKERLLFESGFPRPSGPAASPSAPTIEGEAPPTTVDDAQAAAQNAALQAALSSGDPALAGLAALTMQLQADQADDLPDFIGGIPQGTLLPQNFAEVQQQYEADLAEYNRQSQAERNAFPGLRLDAPGWAPTMGEITYGSPTYMPMDEFQNFATKDPGYINTVQQGLVAAGLMDKDDVVEGVWTADAADAMKDAMEEANYTGGAKTWVDIVQGRAQSNAKKASRSGGGGGGRRANPLAGRTLVLPAYEQPDIDILNTEVKSLMRNRLGREATGWELTLLADSLEQGYRAQYDAQVAAAKANFEAGNRAILQSYRTGKPVTVTSQPAEQVDPRAFLQERFEDRYAPELALNRDRETSRENMENVFNVLTSTSRILGGVS